MCNIHPHDEEPVVELCARLLGVNGAGVSLSLPDLPVTVSEVTVLQNAYCRIRNARQDPHEFDDLFDDPYNDTPTPPRAPFVPPYSQEQEDDARQRWETARDKLRAERLRANAEARRREMQFDVTPKYFESDVVTIETANGVARNVQLSQAFTALVQLTQAAIGDQWRHECGETFIESLFKKIQEIN